MNNSGFNVDQLQLSAWNSQIVLLKKSLRAFKGEIYFEFSIPRMGRRVDVVLIIDQILFVIEFKVGDKTFSASAIDQVTDYAADLKNFHKTSHDIVIAPILIATQATVEEPIMKLSSREGILTPVNTNGNLLHSVISDIITLFPGENINVDDWENGRYEPTPTIIEAALALYNNHNVVEITRKEAHVTNLTDTSRTIENIIKRSKQEGEKSICFVTGVPGAGKTLVGLNVATQHLEKNSETTSVFLSGNGPLVSILREAITRDKVKNSKESGTILKKGQVLSEVKVFIQNVHHFRDDNLKDSNAPFEHIAIFDEAQRAWNIERTKAFMKVRKGISDFDSSEPEFLISCMDRHDSWAVIICLVGGGQEINNGESGISEWIQAINRSFGHWNVYISNRLSDSEYAAGKALEKFEVKNKLNIDPCLHLSVSLRSFRAERLSSLVKHLLDLDLETAQQNFGEIAGNYPILLTRDLSKAKLWLKSKALGSERYGLVVSSRAQRLKPYSIDVRYQIDPIHWFLNGKDDVRSSFFLEDVATEFHVQGLELDWTCVTWDADFRFSGNKWDSFSFKGNRWNRVNTSEGKLYSKNAYRVLLTRARQGMIIVVPFGDNDDDTRKPEYYDSTFNYLKNIGFPII